jgi:hypothetical protein
MRVRYWVIYNNQLRFPPQVMQEKWPNIVRRAAVLSNQTSTVTAIRHLYTRIEVARLKYKIDAQVLLISIPNDWTPSKDDAFDKGAMNELADIGERMGADPTSWHTEPP